MLKVDKSIALAAAGMRQGIRDRKPADPDLSARSGNRRAPKTKAVKGTNVRSADYSSSSIMDGDGPRTRRVGYMEDKPGRS